MLLALAWFQIFARGLLRQLDGRGQRRRYRGLICARVYGKESGRAM